MPEVIAPSEHVYRSILTPGFPTPHQDWTKSFINSCGFWGTWKPTEVSVAGLAEAEDLGQTLLMASLTTKLHKQLEVQQGTHECASLRAHRTADMLSTVLCTAELLPSKFSMPVLLSSWNCVPNLSFLRYPQYTSRFNPGFLGGLGTVGNLETDFCFVLFSKSAEGLTWNWLYSDPGWLLRKAKSFLVSPFPTLDWTTLFWHFSLCLARLVHDLFQFTSNTIARKEPTALINDISQHFYLYNFFHSFSAISTSLSLPSLLLA